MAGDWIKMRGNLWDDPRVARICDLTDSGEAAVIGALYWLWAAADQHTEDGCMPGLTIRQIDRKTGVPGFGAALIQIGWLRDDPQGVVIVNFEEHNGTSAKRRCTDAQRKANSRTVSASDADNTRTDDGQKAPNLGAREEKRREEEIPSTLTGAPAFPAEKPPLALVESRKVPDCPHQAVLALWGEVLPAMPQHNPGLWKGSRAKHLQARWRETAVEKGWATDAEGLSYLRKLFGYVGQSAFLMGRTKTRDGKPPFVIELAWLVCPENWTKTIEGKYHQEAA